MNNNRQQQPGQNVGHLTEWQKGVLTDTPYMSNGQGVSWAGHQRQADSPAKHKTRQ